MIAFGIDPGSVRTGWGVVESEGSRLRSVDFGVITAREKDPLADRLSWIFEGLTRALEASRPDEIFLESIFHHQNAKSALVLGHARGVALLAASRAGKPIAEIAPAEVKKAVAGSGRADKEQVKEMIRIQLGLRECAPADASDALAIAIAGAVRSRFARLIGEAG
jgi:crossover junction endodeoxyribonuclease RuvC